jgi:hypothetical protein
MSDAVASPGADELTTPAKKLPHPTWGRNGPGSSPPALAREERGPEPDTSLDGQIHNAALEASPIASWSWTRQRP